MAKKGYKHGEDSDDEIGKDSDSSKEFDEDENFEEESEGKSDEYEEW